MYERARPRREERRVTGGMVGGWVIIRSPTSNGGTGSSQHNSGFVALSVSSAHDKSHGSYQEGNDARDTFANILDYFWSFMFTASYRKLANLPLPRLIPCIPSLRASHMNSLRRQIWVNRYAHKPTHTHLSRHAGRRGSTNENCMQQSVPHHLFFTHWVQSSVIDLHQHESA